MEQYLAKLAASGLTEGDGASLGLVHCLPGTPSPQWLPIPGTGFEIPYFDASGEPTGFSRYRYLGDPRGGFYAATAKPMRYVQPKGAPSMAYFPRLGLPWSEILVAPQVPLIITEGELKAACACAQDFAAIGLGGVWSFRSGPRLTALLPELDAIEWKGRSVYIVYDADARSNPNVAAAENKLATELLQRGALLYIVRLPDLPNVPKTGLDDFLVHAGKDALELLLKQSSQYVSAKELFSLNEEVVYIRNPGLIMKLENLQRMTPSAFMDHAYANRIYYKPTMDKNGAVGMKETSAPREWLKWASRSECEQVVYAPGEPVVTNRNLNVWKGWGCEPKEGPIDPWNTLLDKFFEFEPEGRRWFEAWLAWPLQHPGYKLPTYSVIWSIAQGTGKSFLGYTMLKIYGDNGTEISHKTLTSDFNEYAENRCFIMADEAKSGDKRISSSEFKSVVTRKLLRINTKYVPAYTVEDRLNYYLTAQDPDCVYLEDDDRRAFILEVKGRPYHPEFYAEYEKWYLGDGPSSLFHYLLNLDLSWFNPMGHAPVTTSKRAMIVSNRSELAAFVASLKEDPDTVLQMGGKPLQRDLWAAAELLQLYDPERRTKVTINGLSRELHRQGFDKLLNGDTVRTCIGKVALYAIRSGSKYARLRGGELGPIFDKERAGRGPKF